MSNSIDRMIDNMAPAVREMCFWLKVMIIWNYTLTFILIGLFVWKCI